MLEAESKVSEEIPKKTKEDFGILLFFMNFYIQ